MKTKLLLITIALLLCSLCSFGQETGTFTDPRDGKVYKTVKMGTQIWMAENLAFKPPGGYYSYDNDSTEVEHYGYFYHWETAKIICPKGWHIPTVEEWAKLSIFLGGRKPNYWKGNNVPFDKLTSTKGFSARLGGLGNIVRNKTNMYIVEYDGYSYTYASLDFEKDGFYLSGEFGAWWTEKNDGKGTIIWLSEQGGFSCSKKSWDRVCNVRCIKNER
jgi:uncharacterized protein (TIGR02145 family)